jgi:lipopolysaccharide transport system ATP-binding protein
MGSVRVTNLGKAYKQYHSRWGRLIEWFSPVRVERHSLKWVLRDINFAVRPGEAIGIVGINGAGKSTLLKMITGTTQPTTGDVSMTGTVAALLELGMGFHPEFTGRQNVLMAGQLLGYSAEDLLARMGEIESFAEIGPAIDEPVRVYSSGMQVRLAFSVATVVRPDILIVDEALAVGDIYFQQKCFDRIESYIKGGTTLLFVSHSTGTILNLCSRALLLKDGMLAYDGPPKDVLDLYQADLLLRLDHAPDQIKFTVEAEESESEGDPWNDHQIAARKVPGKVAGNVVGKIGSLATEIAECLLVRFVDQAGKEVNTILADREVVLKIVYRVNKFIEDPHVGFKIRNRFGVVLFESNTYCMGQSIGSIEAGTVLSVQFKFTLALAPDDYTITVGFGNSGYGEGSFREVLSYLHEVMAFVVVPNPASIKWAGMINLNPDLTIEKHPGTH